MARKRSLKDLYVRGKLLEVDDGSGESVKVWLQKLNPVEYSECLKKADAARARVIAILRDKESDEYVTAVADVVSADKENLIEVLCAIEQGRIDPLVRAEIESESRWADENYLAGLREAWLELEEVFIDDPEHKEARRTHDELKAFVEQCEKELEYRIESFREGLEVATDEELRDMAIRHNLKLMGDVQWMNEFYRQQVFHAVRDEDDHSQRYFDSRSELDELQEEVYGALYAGVQDLMVDPIEGKDSAAQPPSST
jgi:hypothetical protein